MAPATPASIPMTLCTDVGATPAVDSVDVGCEVAVSDAATLKLSVTTTKVVDESLGASAGGVVVGSGAEVLGTALGDMPDANETSVAVAVAPTVWVASLFVVGAVVSLSSPTTVMDQMDTRPVYCNSVVSKQDPQNSS